VDGEEILLYLCGCRRVADTSWRPDRGATTYAVEGIMKEVIV